VLCLDNGRSSRNFQKHLGTVSRHDGGRFFDKHASRGCTSAWNFKLLKAPSRSTPPQTHSPFFLGERRGRGGGSGVGRAGGLNSCKTASAANVQPRSYSGGALCRFGMPSFMRAKHNAIWCMQRLKHLSGRGDCGTSMRQPRRLPSARLQRWAPREFSGPRPGRHCHFRVISP
jgi:hypothetical protein